MFYKTHKIRDDVMSMMSWFYVTEPKGNIFGRAIKALEGGA